MKNRIIHALALLFALALTAPQANATVIQISGTGTSVDPLTSLGLFANPTFSFEIVLDATVSDSGPFISDIARFEGAVTSFIVEGQALPIGAANINSVTFSRFGGIDSLSIFLGNSLSTAVLLGSLPLDFLGSGPFSLSQLIGLEVSDFLPTTAIVDVNDAVAPDSAGFGTITSLSVVEVVPIPLPGTLPLLLVGMTGLVAIRRRTVARSDGIRAGVPA